MTSSTTQRPSITSSVLSPSANDRWDRWVAASSTGHLLQSSTWGDFKSGHGWDAVRVAVERDGEIVAGAQVFFRQALGLSVGYVPRGPVLDNLTTDTCRLLLDAIASLARRRRSIFLLVEPNCPVDSESHDMLPLCGLIESTESVQPTSTIKLDLTKSEEELLSGMKPKTRYNVRLAMKRGVTVRKADSVADIDIFCSLTAETAKRDRFGVHEPSYYRHAWETFHPKDLCSLLIAEHDGDPIAAIMVFRFGLEAIYMYGASSDFKREHMPNYLLQWEGIRWAKAKGCKVYDLWGIPPEITPETEPTEEMLQRRGGLWGVYRFKSGFGGSVVNYPMAYKSVYNRPIHWLYSRRSRTS
jgi:peptidoglycan pentaglycine glycine transferase (the first glycine)